MIKAFTNRFVSDKTDCKFSDLPIDLQQDLFNLRSDITFIFMTDYRYFVIEDESLSVFSKGKVITKLNDALSQPTVALLTSIKQKAANL